ncbi:hypothetical protein XENORESO_010109 [Xenotaenia resolanae]|uniref:Secreted protein n=1 Tax=Xenotaenia resolanae TaxID=208358 RepID=A0ABV0WAN0_9TELE
MCVFALQNPEICSSACLPAVCFSFATGSHEVWSKLGYLGNTCGLDVQFADNVRMLFLAYRALNVHFCSRKHPVDHIFSCLLRWELKKLNLFDVAFRCFSLRCR